ncbi:Enoyl-CoA hydratase, mitochondrial [Cyphellophora attinorum]|uniref:Enoyl-CoA hydratase, mitochondrial n=1 Tax=Cyphellophora attinorum TaxID=1664694 RepID=A0A0N0NJ70_9EURO|nr:Enoyl-CoA hydratase, mitochondrial [Phialophora attinorum]KPI36269.1 Enoyl-CoA hydratase, mitochondrial [Phialophora attinorum]
MGHPTQIPPPLTPTFLKLTFPSPRVVLVTMDRPSAMNCINAAGAEELSAVWTWLDEEPNLTVAVITGAGDKAFSAGADLKEWSQSLQPGGPERRVTKSKGVGLSRRRGKKPVIAAVNGLALGGGTEFAVNCDLVVAAENASFGLPEVTRGVAPFAGALPRLIRSIGLQRASELALTGQRISSRQAYEWGLVNKVVSQKGVVQEALRYAALIAANSPDSIICTRAGLREGWAKADVEDAVQTTMDNEFAELQKGENIKEGLKAFAERREPRWKPSRL